MYNTAVYNSNDKRWTLYHRNELNHENTRLINTILLSLPPSHRGALHKGDHVTYSPRKLANKNKLEGYLPRATTILDAVGYLCGKGK